MEIKQINEILTNLLTYPSNKYTKVLDTRPSDYNEEKSRGDESIRAEVWDLKQDSLLVQLTYTSDSYGNNESITNIQFVKPTTKTVTAYEPV